MSLGTWYLPSRSRKNQEDLENCGMHFLWTLCTAAWHKVYDDTIFMTFMNDVKIHRKIPSRPGRIFSSLQNNASAVLISFGTILVFPDLDQDPVFCSKVWVQYTVETGIKFYLHPGQWNRDFCLINFLGNISKLEIQVWNTWGDFLLFLMSLCCEIMWKHLNWINTEYLLQEFFLQVVITTIAEPYLVRMATFALYTNGK